MTMTTTMIHRLALNEEEYKAIKTLEPMLANLQEYFGMAITLQAVDTGEVITGEEIARMRGVLNFLYTHHAVEVI